MKQVITLLLLSILITGIGVRMFKVTLEPALAEGHRNMIVRFQQWGYSDE